MKLWTKFLVLALVLISLMTLGIKFYFMKQANHYLELSVKDQIKRDMRSFENIIVVVAAVAGKNEDIVRKSLFSISANPEIPIQLRRSQFIINQYGPKAGHEAQNKWEQQVFADGKAIFRDNDEFFEYIYPLRANGICQNCHIDSRGKKVAAGSVLGLAIKKVPKSILKESSLSYHIMDLFWENLLLLIFVVLILLGALYYWFVFPLHRLARRLEPALSQLDDDLQLSDNDIEFIGEGMDVLTKNQ